MQQPQNSRLAQLLSEALKQKARTLTKTRFFWEEMSEAIVRGEIPYLDPNNHIKPPMNINEILLRIHDWLEQGKEEKTSFKDLSPAIKANYLGLVKIILDGLNASSRVSF